MHYRKKSGVMALPMKTLVFLFIEMLEVQKNIYHEVEQSGRHDSYMRKRQVASHPRLLHSDIQVAFTCGKFLLSVVWNVKLCFR